MRAHPLLMNGPLVRATLAGLKTQTRRPIKCGCNHLHKGGNPAKLFGDWSLSVPPHQYAGGDLYAWRGKRPELGDWIETVQTDVDDCLTSRVACPLGKAGDRLWVRETWRPVMESWRSFVEYSAGGELAAAGHGDDAMTKLTKVALRFPGGREDIHSEQWHSSIHMPRWACRLVLPLVSVRVERVQDITEEDAKAEGVEPVLMRGIGSYPEWMRPTMREVGGHQKAFELLWKQIYGDALWDANPWVWVAEWDHIEVRK